MLLTLILALGLASIHVFSLKLTFLDGIPRNRFLSVAGGMAIAYVIIRILPAVAHYQVAVEEYASNNAIGLLKNHLYIVILISLIIFYGLERMAKISRMKGRKGNDQDRANPEIFWLHMGPFAFTNLLIGYLLIDQDKSGITSLLLFSLAMAFKFIVDDRGLHDNFKGLYDKTGRWILASAVMIGWAINYFADISDIGPGLLQAFVAGAIMLNVLKEELPETRESRYWAFALGSLFYAVLLLAF